MRIIHTFLCQTISEVFYLGIISYHRKDLAILYDNNITSEIRNLIDIIDARRNVQWIFNYKWTTITLVKMAAFFIIFMVTIMPFVVGLFWSKHLIHGTSYAYDISLSVGFSSLANTSFPWNRISAGAEVDSPSSCFSI